MTENENVALARKACSHLEARYQDGQAGITPPRPLDYHPLIDMFAEDGVFKVPCPPGTPVFGGEFRGKDAIKKLFLEDDPDLIEGLVVEKPLEYFANGDRVVVLTSYAYTIKKTGAVAKGKDIALVLDFAHGRIAVATEIQDLSEWVDAYSRND